MNRFFLGVIIFLCGAITMIFEILGSRVLGPYFGTSVFVWTSLIGIIMGSLSVGYWLGGKVSDRKNNFTLLGWMLLLAGFFILLTAIGNEYLLKRAVKYISEFRIRTLISTLVLFGPASLFLGMVLPYSAGMVMKNIRTSGSAIGNLYALSTMGSIIGTFAAGFLLVPAFGFINVLFVITLFLFLLSVVLFIYKQNITSIVSSCILISVTSVLWFGVAKRTIHYIDEDTPYNRVLIYETKDTPTGRPVKMLKVNDEKSSAMFLDADDDLVFEVLKYYRLVEHFNPEFQHSMMIGGSGYAFPKDHLRRYPEKFIDVVEIDAGLTKLAKLHFGLPDDTRLKIFHEDGRTYLNRCQVKYDAVFMDAYKSMLTIPYQLTTLEAVDKIYHVLNDDGAVYANIISSLNPDENLFLQSEIKTYMQVFPQVYLFAVQYPNPSEKEKNFFQNFLLVGLKSLKKPEFESENSELNSYLSHLINIEPGSSAIVLTDEFAPVEFYASRAMSRSTRQK